MTMGIWPSIISCGRQQLFSRLWVLSFRVMCPMTGEKNERWMELCEKAATEYDGEKLHELILEIDRLLEEKQQRLRNPDQSQ